MAYPDNIDLEKHPNRSNLLIPALLAGAVIIGLIYFISDDRAPNYNATTSVPPVTRNTTTNP